MKKLLPFIILAMLFTYVQTNKMYAVEEPLTDEDLEIVENLDILQDLDLLEEDLALLENFDDINAVENTGETYEN